MIDYMIVVGCKKIHLLIYQFDLGWRCQGQNKITLNFFKWNLNFIAYYCSFS